MPALSVRRAVIPAAGRGLRLRPLSLFVPKELLPAGSLPMIGRAVAEAAEAGIPEICVVLRRGKEAIARYLEAAPEARGCRVVFRWQATPLGMGQALRAARDFVGEEPFLCLLPDQFLLGGRSASRQLLAAYRVAEPTILSSLVGIPGREQALFPGARPLAMAAGELPRLRRGIAVPVRGLRRPVGGGAAGSARRLVGFGRTVYPAAVMPFLTRRFADPRTGEVDLWETFRALAGRMAHRGLLLRGRPVDLGTLAGYRRYLPRLLRGGEPGAGGGA